MTLTKTKKLLPIVGIIAFVLIFTFAFLLIKKPEKPENNPPTSQVFPPSEKKLKLSDFPEVFRENTLIITGDNASEVELQAVNEIAEYLETYGQTEEEMKIKCCVECVVSFYPPEATRPYCGYFITNSCKKTLDLSNAFETFNFCSQLLREKGFQVSQEVIYPNRRRICNLNIYYEKGYCKCPEGSKKIEKTDTLGKKKEICIDSLKTKKYSEIREEDKKITT